MNIRATVHTARRPISRPIIVYKDLLSPQLSPHQLIALDHIRSQHSQHSTPKQPHLLSYPHPPPQSPRCASASVSTTAAATPNAKTASAPRRPHSATQHRNAQKSWARPTGRARCVRSVSASRRRGDGRWRRRQGWRGLRASAASIVRAGRGRRSVA